jgi:hypothetical protein
MNIPNRSGDSQHNQIFGGSAIHVPFFLRETNSFSFFTRISDCRKNAYSPLVICSFTMEIVFSSSWSSFGAPHVDIEETSVEPEPGNNESDESQIFPKSPKMDSSMLTVCRNMLLSGFGSTASVSLNPPQVRDKVWYR